MSELSPAAAGAQCFHCGLPVPAGTRLSATIGGERRPMCCAGCQAVAEIIAEGGFEAYYSTRESAALRQPGSAQPELEIYDRPEVQAEFVRTIGRAREATLLIEGITCAACIWLNEQRLSRLRGVEAAEINYATRRAWVRWDPDTVKLSQILRAVETIGYRAFPSNRSVEEHARRRENRAALWRLFVAGFGTMQVMMYAVPAYLAADGSMSRDIELLMRLASLVLTVPVVFYSAAPFFRSAARDLRMLRLGMDVPVAGGIAIAFAASVLATFRGGGAVYFDSITMFIFLLLCGRYVELRARQRAAASLDYLDRSVPLTAHRLKGPADRLDWEDVPVQALRKDDVILVRAGEAFAADGVVLTGTTEADESLLTGESRPLLKQLGDPITAGTVNRLSPVTVRVERVAEDTSASHIRRLAERAAGQRPRLVALTDRMAGWFVAGVLATAACATLYWSAHDPQRALWIAVSVLVVTCPCALSLATPTAWTVAIGALARRGVVVTRGQALDALSRVTHVVFDKTGTLTEGQLSLRAITVAGTFTRTEALGWAATLEQGSEHPIGRALLAAARSAGISPAPGVCEVRSVPGRGVEAVLGGIRMRLGTAGFVAEIAGAAPEAGAAVPTGLSRVGLGGNQGWIAWFDLSDRLRPASADVIGALRARGLRLLMLSGDDPSVVRSTADRLGIDEALGALSPAAKQACVRRLQEQGAVVAMVGDGVNDAPVLAQAQVSIAMGSGAVASQAQADLVLLEGRLERLVEALQASRTTMRIVRQNLWWALIYNFLALPLAVTGHVTPWLAGIGMAGSSLAVVLNALRLGAQPEARGEKREDPRHEAREQESLPRATLVPRA